jgi:hypothetical protein
MNKISSNSTGFYKRVFPAMWFGFIAVFVGVALLSGAVRETNGAFLLGPSLMAVFGYFVMRRFIWDLADEVYDCGDYLLVRNRGVEENVALSNIMNVSMSAISSGVLKNAFHAFINVAGERRDFRGAPEIKRLRRRMISPGRPWPGIRLLNQGLQQPANPPRLELRLVKPGRFGTEVVFSPTRPFSFNPFARNPVAEDLIVRVDRARTKRAG